MIVAVSILALTLLALSLLVLTLKVPEGKDLSILNEAKTHG
ncbi:MAG: hypothetical protein P8N72_08455 [Flavimaricola sp.]|nr:hypothetical protein [Flavimaricola sp.]